MKGHGDRNPRRCRLFASPTHQKNVPNKLALMGEAGADFANSSSARMRFYSPAYSFLAWAITGNSGSAFFHSAKNRSYAAFAFVLSPAMAYARPSPSSPSA